MRFLSNVNDDVQLIVEIEMEEDIKREAFVWTNENPASNEDDINSRCIQYKQGRHLAIYLISNTTLVTIRNKKWNYFKMKMYIMKISLAD